MGRRTHRHLPALGLHDSLDHLDLRQHGMEAIATGVQKDAPIASIKLARIRTRGIGSLQTEDGT